MVPVGHAAHKTGKALRAFVFGGRFIVNGFNFDAIAFKYFSNNDWVACMNHEGSVAIPGFCKDEGGGTGKIFVHVVCLLFVRWLRRGLVNYVAKIIYLFLL